jgi:hypothetical protein
VAYWHLRPSDIAGTARGSVYYAYDAATGTYWAKAIFVPSATASQNAIVDQQDGDNAGLFTRTSSGAWRMRPEGMPPGCGIRAFLPTAVITVWALPKPFCPSSTG